MPFRNFPGIIVAGGTADVQIQQDNAAMEWDIYQISVSGPPATSPNLTASINFNGFFVCSTPQGTNDTATGPPDILLSRGDVLDILFASGNPGDRVNVTIWYTENGAGQTLDLSP